MTPTTRNVPAALATSLILASFALGQQPAAPPAGQQALPPQQPAVQQPAVQQPPDGFRLNALEEAYLNQVLEAWQRESSQIETFKCAFQRWEYDVAFGPVDKKIPLNKNLGELSYHKPDKGSFQITEIHTFQAVPAPPGQQPAEPVQGNWVKQADAIGEHWVCDGKSVFEYRHNQKQLVERPIPPQLQGQSIVDGPLPFLFGAEAEKLKQRYWLRVHQPPNPNPAQVWIVARPRHQAQAADFREIEVILNRERLLPEAMQVHLPNGSRHMYLFDIAKASVNNRFAILQSLFERPRVPLGWKRVVEQVPVQQASQPAPTSR